MSGLTARFVAGVKGEPGKRMEYPEGSINGLSLRVMAPRVENGEMVEAGAKSWALRYRTSSGAQRRLTIGGYPAISLAEARTEALKALGRVAAGEDVAREKQTARRKAKLGRTEKPQTLSDIWAIFEREALAEKRASTRTYQAWLWERRLKPRLGAHELATLDRSTIKLAIKAIGEQSGAVTGNRAFALLRRLLNFAVGEEYMSATPLARMPRPFKEESRSRVLSDVELKTLWAAMEAAPVRDDVAVSRRMVLALRLQLYTATRAGEVSGIHEREIDPAARTWVVPPSRHKSGKDHVIPLSPAAWAVLLEIFGPAPEQWRGYGFPNARYPNAPMERASMTKAMQRIVLSMERAAGEAGATQPSKASKPDAMASRARPHDLRRTVATLIASERVGVPPHVVTAILGHAAEGPAVTATYNRHRYDAEKRRALEAWALLLGEIVGGTERASNVRRLSHGGG